MVPTVLYVRVEHVPSVVAYVSVIFFKNNTLEEILLSLLHPSGERIPPTSPSRDHDVLLLHRAHRSCRNDCLSDLPLTYVKHRKEVA